MGLCRLLLLRPQPERARWRQKAQGGAFKRGLDRIGGGNLKCLNDLGYARRRRDGGNHGLGGGRRHGGNGGCRAGAQAGLFEQAGGLGLVIIALGVKLDRAVMTAIGQKPGAAQIFDGIDEVGFGVEQIGGLATEPHGAGRGGQNLHQSVIGPVAGCRVEGALAIDDAADQFERHAVILRVILGENFDFRARMALCAGRHGRKPQNEGGKQRDEPFCNH